jgi:hypothetical protein
MMPGIEEILKEMKKEPVRIPPPPPNPTEL